MKNTLNTLHKIDLELNASYSFKITCFFKEYQKKELKGNDYMLLYGQLSLLCLYNDDILQECSLSMRNVIDGASIQDDELYLNGFEGYQLSDRLTLNSLFLNEHNCVIASVYDAKFDRFLHFVI